MSSLQPKVWTSKLVIESILALREANQPISLRSVGLYKKPIADPIISSVVGCPTSRKLLYEMACNYYGSWDLAIKACNLTPRRAPFKRFWNRKIIVKAIRALKKSGHPLNVGKIWRDDSRKTTRIILEATGKKTTGMGLHDAARRYFGSWDNALIASRIPVSSVKEKTFWTKEKIIAAIQALDKEGVALNSASVDKATGRKAKKVIQMKIGKGRYGKSLLGGAYRAFGSWDRALREANMDPEMHRRKKFSWTPRTVGMLLKVLHKSGVPINAANLSKDKSDLTREIIFKVSGKEINGSKVFRLGQQKLGSWDAAIKYSGFYLSAVRKRCVPCSRDQEKIGDMLRALVTHEFALNTSSVRRNSKRMRLFNEVDFDCDVSGEALQSAAKKLFSSWEKALWDAGFDPSEIYLKSHARRSNIPIIPLQVEDTVLPTGERRLVTYMGAAPKSPEEMLTDKEEMNCVEAAVENFGDDDRTIANEVIDQILQIHHYRDQKQLVKFISQRLNGRVSEEKIAAIFLKLAGSIKKNIQPSSHIQ